MKIGEVIVVEGKYDKNTLSQIVDALIIETNGFAIRNDRAKLDLIRRLAEARGIIILTDSDSAGFMIRDMLKGSISPDLIKNAYIPDIYGKEARKSASSKEGKIGVEGMDPRVIIDALIAAGATCEELAGKSGEKSEKITKADFFAWGLSGGADSSKMRDKLKSKLKLPARLSTNALLDVINRLYTKDEIINMLFEAAEV